jgi:hypothetical protein
VLYAAASNIDSCLWKDTYVSSTQLNWPIWKRESLSPPETAKLQEAFLLKTNSILIGNNVQEAPASNTDEFLW